MTHDAVTYLFLTPAELIEGFGNALPAGAIGVPVLVIHGIRVHPVGALRRWLHDRPDLDQRFLPPQGRAIIVAPEGAVPVPLAFTARQVRLLQDSAAASGASASEVIAQIYQAAAATASDNTLIATHPESPRRDM
jgi:hypothetical protein